MTFLADMNVVARVVFAREAAEDGDLVTAAAVLEDLEHDLREYASRWITLDDGASIPDMSL